MFVNSYSLRITFFDDCISLDASKFESFLSDLCSLISFEVGSIIDVLHFTITVGSLTMRITGTLR
jgi:hypothetical protein